MGNFGDRDHFEDYREQTRVKHEILEAYLLPYFTIVGKGYNQLLFVDGFAGRATYTKASTGEEFDGSPLRALKLVTATPRLAGKVDTLFIESDDVLFESMDRAVANYAKINRTSLTPMTFHGTFEAGIAELLKQAKGSLPPTFLFVDPCGVSGTNFGTIQSVMSQKSSEAFIFFNIAAVKRIAGLEAGETLIELFGSAKRAEALLKAIRATSPTETARREMLILEHYRVALKEEMGITFTLPFRVESEDKQSTSHYLIHATKYYLGFALMKDIMWKRGHSQHGQGDLGFAQASRTNYIPLFDPKYDIKKVICNALASGPQKVDTFYFDWTWRPDDVQCESSYKELLKELESAGTIEILDKDGKTPKPAKSRIRSGKVTLGKGHFARLTE